MLTSGTTGPPKRIDLTYDTLARSVLGPEAHESPAPTELRQGVAIVNSPLVHLGGLFRMLQCVNEAGRSRCSSGSSSTSGPTPCAGTGPAR